MRNRREISLSADRPLCRSKAEEKASARSVEMTDMNGSVGARHYIVKAAARLTHSKGTEFEIVKSGEIVASWGAAVLRPYKRKTSS